MILSSRSHPSDSFFLRFRFVVSAFVPTFLGIHAFDCVRVCARLTKHIRTESARRKYSKCIKTTKQNGQGKRLEKKRNKQNQCKQKKKHTNEEECCRPIKRKHNNKKKVRWFWSRISRYIVCGFDCVCAQCTFPRARRQFGLIIFRYFERLFSLIPNQLLSFAIKFWTLFSHLLNF